VFYPPGLPHSRELEFASRAVTAIEINSTYHRLQKPQSFAAWAAAVPDGFVFSVKGSFTCSNRKNLGEGAEAVRRFFSQGLTELGPKLGPILWQLMPHKAFDPQEVAAFLALLPRKLDGVRLRHAIEPRHESFRTPEFIALARRAGVAVVVADSEEYPQIADVTGSFVYARLQRSREDIETGYDTRSLTRWAKAAREWAGGEQPAGLTYVCKRARASNAAEASPPSKISRPRDVFLFVIDGAKVRAPAAACALLQRLGGERSSRRR